MQRDTGSIHGQGTKIPHTLGQLNPLEPQWDATPKCCNENPVQSKQNVNSDHFPSPSKLTTAIPCAVPEGIRGPCSSPKALHGAASATFSSSSPSMSWVSILSSHTSHQTTPPTRWSTFPLQSSHSGHSFCLKNTFLAPFKDMGSFFLLPRFCFPPQLLQIHMVSSCSLLLQVVMVHEVDVNCE